MTRKALILLMIAALAAMFVVGCSDDDDDNNPTGGGNTQTPETPAALESLTNLQETGVTSHLNSIDTDQDPNGYCAMAASFIESVEDFELFLVPPASAARQVRPSLALTDTVSYTWTEPDYTVTMLWIETASEYIWRTMITGTWDGTAVTDFVVIEAHQSLAATDGWMEWSLPGFTGYVVRWEWSETAGVFTLTITGGEDLGNYEVNLVVYADGSGYCEYTLGTYYWTVTWNASGTSGTWTGYGGSGTWSYTG